jgi:hypothetical protein
MTWKNFNFYSVSQGYGLLLRYFILIMRLKHPIHDH